MKKLVSIILAFVMLFSVAILPAFAQTSIAQDPNNLFEEILIEKFYNNINSNPETYEYKELEYHYNEQGEIDWALVYACFPYFEPDIMCAVACGRVWELMDLSGPWHFVYDVEKQKFEFIFYADWSKYEGIEEAVARAQIGRPIGDANFNGQLDIMDATEIQLVLAGLSEFRYSDDIYEYYPIYNIKMNDENLKYVCDIDRDGQRTILDATTIQLKLAGIE